MSGSRMSIALSLDHDRLVAVCGSVVGKNVQVRGWVSAQAPSGVDPRDAKKVGEWVKGELDKAGLTGGRLVIAVPRGDVVIKKLKLPRPESGGEAELAGMVRLQMARQLTMAIEGTAIDYATIDEQDAGANVSVLAGALPADKMGWYRDMAEAADCSIERVGLRAAGVAALLASVSQRHNGPVLGVAIGFGSIEFVVVKDGQLVFARAVDIGLAAGGADTEGGLSQKIAVEAKRTWMSYRIGDEAATVEAVVVPGDGPLAREVGEACGKALELPWETAALPGTVELPTLMPEADRLVAAPLVGLLGEEVLSRPSFDFAHPRKPPDLAAARRRLVLIGLLGAILVGGSGYVYSGIQVSRIKSKLTDAKERNTVLRSEYTAYLKEHARLSHIQKWNAAGFDWLSHASWLSEQMPDPRQAQLDQLVGAAGIAVELVPDGGRYDPAGWQVRQVAKFSIQGRAKQREVSNELRDRLVSSPIYQVETKGADLADRFAMELSTQYASPEDVTRTPAKTSEPKAKTPPTKGADPKAADPKAAKPPAKSKEAPKPAEGSPK